MEQQRERHNPREEEEEQEAVALQRRQSRQRSSSAPDPPYVIFSTNYNGNDENGVHEEGNKEAIEAASSKEEEIMSSEHLENKKRSFAEVEEIHLETAEYDVERVIETQNTYDLFCPRCKNCITRTVILRRKERPPTSPIRVFSCLPCVKFFIPKGEKTNCFISMFSSIPIFWKEEVKPPQGGLDSPSPSLAAAGDMKPPAADSNVSASPNQSGDVESQSQTGVSTTTLAMNGEVHEWDVMKSIVYGGLAESITGLGVVSSAAAAGATTLNIFAMGLANLISGLLILGYNLNELKKEKLVVIENQSNEKGGRYQELLGRGNFSLHATVAVMSYLVFGLLPPIIYGFAFRQSDNKDYKLAAVLGASLICITLLSIAKSYANKEPANSYITTLLYYLSTGAVAACASYLVGVFIKKLMEKLGWFDSTSSSSSIDNISFMGTKSVQPTWASY